MNDASRTPYRKKVFEHKSEDTATPAKALLMLLKAFVGTGVTFLPGSFASGGLIFSICLMVFIAAICLVAFQILIIAQRQVGGSYGDLGRSLYGPWLEYLILFFLCISQMGFVASYLIFISQNIGLAVGHIANCGSPIESKYFIWMVLSIIIPLTWVRKIARLSWCAIIADVFILFGLLSILYFSTSQIMQSGPGPDIQLINTKDFALMIGTAVFSFEGIGMVIPIVEGMEHPEKFPLVMNIGMCIVAAIFILIGAIGYLAFGANTFASIVANLPRVPLSTAVQILYSCAMVLTCPFMLYPALSIVEDGLFSDHGLFGHQRGRKSLKWKWAKNLCRSTVAAVCAIVSFAVGPAGLDKFVALVGSVACMPLCFIFPGMFHYKVTNSKWKRGGDVIMIAWGFAIMVYTICINVHTWINPSSSSRPTPVECPQEQNSY
ncbi:transmembrane amino acid transporter protein-domain-containing protein [Dichotomocladium elegans]|nr:transmembrane amino acid transporter protein-domain-containing protein [Dichotomocladium elegans]